MVNCRPEDLLAPSQELKDMLRRLKVDQWNLTNARQRDLYIHVQHFWFYYMYDQLKIYTLGQSGVDNKLDDVL